MDLEPRSKETLIKQFREETLTEATRRIINAEGYAGLTIERVAEAAGVSKGTIYLYFKNKEDLVHATVASTFAALIQGVRAATDAAPGGFRGKLRALVAAQLTAFAENVTFLRGLLADRNFRPHAGCDDTKADVITMHAELVHHVAAILELGRDEGVVRLESDYHEIAYYVVQILQSIGIRHALGLAPEPPASEAEINRILQFIEHGIGRQGA